MKRDVSLTLHPSIINIKSNFTPKLFGFSKISVTDVRKYVLKLDSKKKTSGGIPTKILQDSLQRAMIL